MTSMEAYDAIRWEARSHRRIFEEVHKPDVGGLSLAEAVPKWARVAADLGEVRSLYEGTVRRLLDESAGLEADAIVGTASQVTRNLTEAQERAVEAGDRRMALRDLNDELRRALPSPMLPAEDASNFIHNGFDWLFATDFESADATRLDQAERARDLMRDYEQNIALDRLVHEPSSAPRHEFDRDPTLPLALDRPSNAGSGSQVRSPAGPVTELVPVHITEPATVPLPVPARGGHVPVQDVPTAAGIGPPGEDYEWSFRNFGPVGAEPEVVEPADDDVAPGGAPPPRREYMEEEAGPIRSSDADPFDPDRRVAPPVLGG